METGPTWSRLFDTASSQEGYFTTEQAATAGYSPQLLVKHVLAGRIMRTRRGIYRLVHFPAGEHEDLVTVWLWSEREGVLSHETALMLHQLSDVMPAHVHLSLPEAWRRRRFRVPPGVVLHHADVVDGDRVWVGPVPVTSPKRTLLDCADAYVSPETIERAIDDAARRGIVSRKDIAEVEQARGRASVGVA